MVSKSGPADQISGEDVRRTIGEIWRQVLRVEKLGDRDNFFELGGHSLTASQIISRIERTLHVEVPMGEFFERPTVEQLTEFVLRYLGHEGSAQA
ncbi:phosphopantetheine-binding protein [Streptomyces catenulae]|uniref:Phosphopantetheine-binding protein n=1 Tax=Streptomyces catenulae TaxID=66875 RepID=A0ABV2Z1Z0_9ACTN|nr:phosphopantetheine-binding protein [Streptomyces catenulae]